LRLKILKAPVSASVSPSITLFGFVFLFFSLPVGNPDLDFTEIDRLLSFANAFFSKRDFFASFRSFEQVRRVSFFRYSDKKSQSQTNQQTGKLRLPGD
jgi:hypothetical protein